MQKSPISDDELLSAVTLMVRASQDSQARRLIIGQMVRHTVESRYSFTIANSRPMSTETHRLTCMLKTRGLMP